MNLRPPFYIYRKVRIVRLIDGDTVVVDLEIDVGFGTKITTRETVRIAGLNAPEVVGASRDAGLAAKAWLADALAREGGSLRMLSAQRDKYGRRLAVFMTSIVLPLRSGDLEVYLDDEFAGLWAQTINAEMVRSGRAVEYWGEGPKT